MHDAVTILRPEAPLPDARGISSAFPPEVLEQVRGRVRLLALLILVAFAFDLVIYAGNWAAALAGHALPASFFESGWFQLVNLAAVAASAGLWWVARSRHVSTSRLHTLGLAYEIAICFIIATLTFWQYYVVNGTLPNLTWVPVVIVLFPLIMPGPPRRMLAAAIAAGAMPPAALLLLDLVGKVNTTLDAYIQVTVHSAFAVTFAYAGARIVYGLGREVTAARELGSYRLVERLGQGGMGEVWRAQHRLLARSAAIKLIRSSVTTDVRPGVSADARRRFEREAQVIARLRSPHTVELFDFGVAADGAFYYVMELLDGLDLDTLVRRSGPIPAERAMFLLRQVCHSLSEAESCGLVHRDIKPANIFVCRYGEDCRLREGPRFRNREGSRRRRDRPGAHAGQRHSRHAGIHCARAGTGWIGPGRPGRHLCHRVRGLLAAYGATRVHRRHTDDAAHAPRPHAAGRAIHKDGAADSDGARQSCAVVPGEGPGRAAAVRPRAVASARRCRGRRPVDRGPRTRVVGRTHVRQANRGKRERRAGLGGDSRHRTTIGGSMSAAASGVSGSRRDGDPPDVSCCSRQLRGTRSIRMG